MKRKILLFILKSLFYIALASLAFMALALKILFDFALLVLSSDDNDDSHHDDSDYYNILSGELDNTKYHDGIYNKMP